MRDQGTKRGDESVSEILDRAAPVHILAVAPHRLQLAINNAAVDLQQVSPGLLRAAAETTIQGSAKQRRRKHLVQLAPIIKTNLRTRKLTQSLDYAAVTVQVAQ